MTVTLSLDPEVEKNLMALAHQRGISLDEYLQELVAREAGMLVAGQKTPLTKQADNLSDLLLFSFFRRQPRSRAIQGLSASR